MKTRQTSKKLRYALVLFVLLAILALVKVFFFSADTQPNYITTAAYKSDLEKTVLADGSIEAFKIVNVGAQVSGQIKALHVELGDKVVKGQLLAEIDDLTQQNELKEAEASLKNIQAMRASKIANTKNSQIAFERQKTLLAKGVGTQADYDAAKALLDANHADLDGLEAQISKAQIALNTAKVNLGYTKINSPIDGVVVATPVEEGQTVNAVQIAPTIVKVAQLDTMTIKAQISEADVPYVKPGLPVYFTILGEPNKRYSSTLRKVEPAPSSINDSSSTNNSNNASTAIFYNGLLDVPNPEGKLRISMTAQVYIILDQAKDAITIPTTALDLNKEGKQTVRVVDDKGNIITREVVVGINNNISAQIVSGLEVGEKVIVSSGSTANDGNTGSRRMSIRM